MVALQKHKMTVDEYLAWAQERPGRFELYSGVVYAMAPERVRHAEVKFAVQKALEAGIIRSRVPCRMLPDGIAVRTADDSAYEPDALIYCGERASADSLEVPNPVVVVEVLSPSTGHIDATFKLAGYFSLQSVAHYLIIDPDMPLVVHHHRGAGDAITTRILRSGPIRLDPPGIDVAIEDFYPPAS